ncbi:MAG: GNAT family N-acetyltransferase [Erysipelotrichaceae bacterium]|nr:GNAT family N-acetyltransferase [Erysipelotrichaceae bacterium]
MDVKLVLFREETEIAIDLIKKFWKEHSNAILNSEEAMADLNQWTKEGHRFYLINNHDRSIGFVHLGSRGCETDWLEDIFILPEYQGKGIGTYTIQLIEDIVKEYSDSLYIEAAARNDKAIRLYHKMGYDCLNTITVRKDFHPDKYEVISQEKIMDMEFEVKKYSD